MAKCHGIDITGKSLLQRSLGPLQLQLISLGGIIGSGYFLGIGTILRQSGAAAVLAFVLGGLIVWLVALAMGELCVGMARKGTFISHASELLGRPWAAGVGWAYWFNWCALIPSEMLAGGMILHQLSPNISILAGGIFCGFVITITNLLNVKYFGHLESGLALVKVGAMALFSGVALLIYMGMQGQGLSLPPLTETLAFSPKEDLGFLVTMVLVLVNFQGTEIIALSAAEAKDPETTIPLATRNIALRTALLYVVPITLLILIFPMREISNEQSPFIHALRRHGFFGLGTWFQWVILSAALSCGNSGLYSAVRALYGLGVEDLAPSWVTQVNSKGIPVPATLFTLLACWLFLPLYFFFDTTTLYTLLLTLSGFGGAICWISISWCQLRLRQKWIREKLPLSSLPFRMPGFPYLSFLSLFLQIFFIGMLVFNSSLRSSLILGLPAFLAPLLFFWLKGRKLDTSKASKV